MLALPLMALATPILISPTFAQNFQPKEDIVPAKSDAPALPNAQGPSNLIRTFAPTGLLAEHNSNENFAGFQARLGTLIAHQASANATGVIHGYRDTVDSLALPLKLTVALSENEDFYLKLGFASAWSDAHGGNLTETDSSTLSGLVSLNYRPDPNLVLGLGMVAGRTQLDFRHNGGDAVSDFTGIQADYMHRLSNRFGLAARAIWSDGSNDTAIPLGHSGKVLSHRQENERLYLEASFVADLPSAASSFLPDGIKLRPIATVMYQSTDFASSVDSRGDLRPAYSEAFGILRAAVRIEKEERRQWRLMPYAIAGIEHEFVNTVSRVDDDPANTYLKAGLGVNVGGHGRVDLYYVRRDSFKGTYNSNQVTLFASLLF